ncbi:MAG: hypothetical protein N2379_01485 [Verrucomicrobiae bacterium]|nr:hypothetical protein [Verrucomicrobiae bacterium]
MPASDIADVTGVTGATAQAGMALILYCDIQIKLRSGGTLVAARGIEGSREAHWLAGQMLCALGR